MRLIEYLIDAGEDPSEIGIPRLLDFDARQSMEMQQVKTDLLRLVLEKRRADPFLGYYPNEDDKLRRNHIIYLSREDKTEVHYGHY